MKAFHLETKCFFAMYQTTQGKTVIMIKDIVLRMAILFAVAGAGFLGRNQPRRISRVKDGDKLLSGDSITLWHGLA